MFETVFEENAIGEGGEGVVLGVMGELPLEPGVFEGETGEFGRIGDDGGEFLLITGCDFAEEGEGAEGFAIQ